MLAVSGLGAAPRSASFARHPWWSSYTHRRWEGCNDNEIDRRPFNENDTNNEQAAYGVFRGGRSSSGADVRVDEAVADRAAGATAAAVSAVQGQIGPDALPVGTDVVIDGPDHRRVALPAHGGAFRFRP